MWIAIWFLLSMFVMGVFAWSQRILLQQKNAWSKCAKKNGFLYASGKFMQSPAMAGKIGDLIFALYTGEQRTNDARGQRFVTVIEFEIGKGTPAAGAIGTPEMKSFIEGLKFKESFTPSVPGWSLEYPLRTREIEKMKTFMTSERLESLMSLFAMKNSSALMFFDEHNSVLRVETPDPLKEAAHLEKIIRRIAGVAEKFVPSAAERIPEDKLPPIPETSEIQQAAYTSVSIQAPMAPLKGEQKEQASVKAKPKKKSKERKQAK